MIGGFEGGGGLGSTPFLILERPLTPLGGIEELGECQGVQHTEERLRAKTDYGTKRRTIKTEHTKK